MQIIRATFGDAEPFELLTRHPTTAVFYFWELKKSLQEHTYTLYVHSKYLSLSSDKGCTMLCGF